MAKIEYTNKQLIKLMEDYMTKHKLLRYELANILGTADGNISKWLNGRHKIGKAWTQLIIQKLVD